MTEMPPDKYGEWKRVPSQPGWWASSRGYVKREAGPSIRRPDVVIPGTSPTRGWLRSTGYVINIMQPDGRPKTISVGRLVCEAFHGPPENERTWARHVDHDLFNNAADNLLWLDRSVGRKRVPRPTRRVRIVGLARD